MLILTWTGIEGDDYILTGRKNRKKEITTDSGGNEND